MSFPAIYVLLPYFVFVALSLMVFFFNVYHIGRFGLQSTRTAFVLGLYTLGFLAVLAISVILLAPYDWTGVIAVSDAFRPSSTLPGL